MTRLSVLDLFSGIGGFSLGLERTGGFKTVAFCEIEAFPRLILAKHWPEVPCYEDVRTLTGARLVADGIGRVDVITGGFPCQDLSVAGKRRGLTDGTRSGLWSEIVRLIGDLRPAYVIVENVAALLSGPTSRRGGWFGRVLGDLAECGYDAEWENIPASALGAPHRRERVWIVAYPKQDGQDETTISRGVGLGFDPGGVSELKRHGGLAKDVSDANKIHAQRQQFSGLNPEGWARPIIRPSGPLLASFGRFWITEPEVGRVANGVSHRSHRLAALGNAVIPQIPELIGLTILSAEASR